MDRMNDNKLSFRDLLNKYRETPIYKLLVADAVDSILIVSEVAELNEEEYEMICDYVYDYIMYSELDCNTLVNYIHDAHMEGLPIIKLILDNKWEEANEIIYKRM